MLSCYPQTTGAEGPNQQSASSYANLSEGSNGQLVLEEDEEEDVDFNPFLKETPSPEASSSLSSDNEGFGAGVVDNVGGSLVFKEIDSLSTKGRNNEKDNLIHCQVSHEGAHDKESEAAATRKPKKKKSASTSQLEIGSIYPEKCNAPNTTVPINDNASTSGTEVVEDVSQVLLTDLRNPSKCVTDWDDEDAICRRTRARYSLANFTLDELETFLQETDDDDDLQNVDDEQEYRKFLAAVLHGGDDENHPIQGNENMYDEDEENDADFEIEIEEALESDLEENIRDKDRKEKYGGAGRRPETRQNKRQKVSVQNKKKILGQANRPLRPLLPFVPNAQMATFPGFGPQKLMPEVSFQCPSSSTQAGLLNGFTPHQIGQLHCLIHEHVQLLVQVFSLCVLDPSRQHIVGELKRMISEIICKRDEVLSWRKVPYPDFCFRTPFIHPSVSNGLLKFSRMEGPGDSSSASCPQKGSPDRDDMTLVSHSISSSKGRYDEHVHGGHADPLQTSESSLWVPLINDPVLSIIDVAPVSLLGSYTHDVSKAVQEYQQRHVESMFDGHYEREPLFPLPTCPLSAEASCGLLGESNSQSSSTVNSSLPGRQKPKKTLAATLVESTKKQSVALVPKQIVKLAQRFYPLFNSALFPHKPPPAPVANRVLFTDAEDDLLALGLMEYNTDWKAIQQRFLPCKTKHQIFVRQKNRCSSKAPENPIKAVRRMKTSPLTAEEKARIHEGLRVLKLDWMSVWRFIVPYRDPSLLPRQWRIALGIQKSYKSDAVKREKRRLYESQRRKCKAAALAHWETASEKEDYLVDNVGEGGDDQVVDEDEACVHEAFLADWGSGNSRIASELPISNPSRRDLQPNSVVPDIIVETPACDDNVLSQPQNGYTHEFLSTLNCSQSGWNVSHLTQLRCDSPNFASHHSGPIGQSRSSKNQVNLRPYRVRRKNVAQLVRLAPDLPPVNLPPSVRIISQSVFESHNCGSSCSTKSSGGAVSENLVPRPAHVAKSGTSAGFGKNKVPSSSRSAINLCPRDQRVFMDQLLTEEKGTESDLQMHPLLFQAHEDANFPYCQMNASRTFNFLPGNQLHANFNHMSISQDASYPIHNSYKTLLSKENGARSFSVEFHPLLQRVDDPSNDAVGFSADRMFIDSELFPGTCTHLQTCSDSAVTDQHINNGGHLGIAPELAGSYEKTNDIDLEIHLCSTSSRDKFMGKSNFAKYSSDGSGIGLRNGSMKQFQKFNNQSHKGNENCPRDSIAVAGSNRGHAQIDNALVLACNTTSRYSEDTIGDHSLPEIVMEQEELSDSEEEIGEHVQFECEEMADSEGEESDCEHFVNKQNKEIPSVPTKEEVSTNATQKEQQCEPSSIFGLTEDKECGITKKSTRCLQNFGLASKGKHKSNTGLLLSLDSPNTVSCHTRSKLGENANSRDGQTASNLSSRPSRSCKKMMRNPRTIQTPMRPLDILQQNHLTTPGDTGVITRKPRKRVYRSNAGVVATGSLEYAGNNDLVENHPYEACPSRNHALTSKGSDLGCLNPSLFLEASRSDGGGVQDMCRS